MDIHLLLQSNCNRLLEQYGVNMKMVQELQSTLIDEVLPSVADELGLNSDQLNWAKLWIQDTQAIFQLLRRDNFTRSFALESIRKNLLWRFKKLWPPEPEISFSRVHFLPDNVRDPFGRPIIVIRTSSSSFKDSSDSHLLLPLLIRTMEQLRLRLKALNATPNQPVLQYIVLLDVKELSIQTLSVDLISWILRDLIPRFPGMLAAVFAVNSSWAHSGMWNIAKRVLPASAVSRVFFPSPQELLAYFTPTSLPKDYGGYLPSLNSNSNPTSGNSAAEITPPPEPSPKSYTSSSTSSSQKPKPIVHLSPISSLNPFFGYPVSFSSSSPSSLRGSSTPSLHHGRRRKRDLLRTLVVLFWIRWQRPITVSLWLIAFLFAGRLWFRRWLLYSPSGARLLKTWMSCTL